MTAWVVLKFGGTSVSTPANWRNIAAVVRERLAQGCRVLVVHSAISGITDRLERLLLAVRDGTQDGVLDEIESRHRQLCSELGIGFSLALERYCSELRQIAAGLALTGEVSDRIRARVMAHGELMATEIGARFLAAQSLAVDWWDARTGLQAEQRDSATARASYLSATCDYSADAALAAQLGALAPVVLTQGFIASNAAGETVLLGRGGSDTSAAYLAAKLQAARLEIWTDVPGMFSANPRSTPSARLLRALHYDEAQEIASSGAKVLHPRCILPAKQGQIPLWVFATQTPSLEGTHVGVVGAQGAARVKAVCIKKGITLVSMDSPGMWHEVGFLADAFQIFKQHGLSVDQVSTSETSVTVSLDPSANTLDQDALERLVGELSRVCRTQLIGPCAQVSLVGRNIRGILHQLGDALSLFAEQRIYMVSQAANDLNFTFVVDEDQGDRLVQELHELLIQPVKGDLVLGPTWQQLYGKPTATASAMPPWWQRRRAELLALTDGRDDAYVYELDSVRQAAARLRALKSVDRVYYAMKANPHPSILRAVTEAGLDIECVSRGEIAAAGAACTGLRPEQLLYTPNFAPHAEYAWALSRGVQVTIDNMELLRRWPDSFRGHELLARIDTGTGRGHHHHVRTAGAHAKFGVPLADVPELASLAERAGARIVGLHGHPGSGVFDPGSWSDTAATLFELARYFPLLRVVNVGGGLGVPDSRERPPVDLELLDSALATVRRSRPELALWLEPGRYLVAEAGVLLARVTQTKRKGDIRYVGIATGMNSLIRPALYGAWHDIVNLTRADVPATESCNVVGPICESADVLGHDRLLPPTEPGDILLIANVGAYGHAMSSRYNLREPAAEFTL